MSEERSSLVSQFASRDSGPAGSALTKKYGNSRDLHGSGSYNSWNIPYPADICTTKTKGALKID